MGEKGARATAVGQQVTEALVQDLTELGDVTTRKMFGGHGVFRDGVMFAIVDPQGSIYLRADETTEQAFVDAGSEKHGRMPYWGLPNTVAGDASGLVEWARTAANVAANAKK